MTTIYEDFTGTGVALITPFNEDLSIDFTAFENLINHCIDQGVNYLVVLGTTAESATLTAVEKKQIIEFVKSINKGRVPLVIGMGGNDTAQLIQRVQCADLSGFSAILSVSPYYNKPTQEGIYQHYKALCKVAPLPIILYNVPGRTGSNISPATTLKLAQDFVNVIAIKEASPDYNQFGWIMKDKPEAFGVISGDDAYALPMVLAGGKGVISVIAQGIPFEFCQMIQEGLQHKVIPAYHKFYKILPIIESIFAEGNPAGIKALLTVKGITKPFVRLPLVPASKALIQQIEIQLKSFS